MADTTEHACPGARSPRENRVWGGARTTSSIPESVLVVCWIVMYAGEKVLVCSTSEVATETGGPLPDRDRGGGSLEGSGPPPVAELQAAVMATTMTAAPQL